MSSKDRGEEVPVIKRKLIHCISSKTREYWDNQYVYRQMAERKEGNKNNMPCNPEKI